MEKLFLPFVFWVDPCLQRPKFQWDSPPVYLFWWTSQVHFSGHSVSEEVSWFEERMPEKVPVLSCIINLVDFLPSRAGQTLNLAKPNLPEICKNVGLSDSPSRWPLEWRLFLGGGPKSSQMCRSWRLFKRAPPWNVRHSQGQMSLFRQDYQ